LPRSTSTSSPATSPSQGPGRHPCRPGARPLVRRRRTGCARRALACRTECRFYLPVNATPTCTTRCGWSTCRSRRRAVTARRAVPRPGPDPVARPRHRRGSAPLRPAVRGRHRGRRPVSARESTVHEALPLCGARSSPSAARGNSCGLLSPATAGRYATGCIRAPSPPPWRSCVEPATWWSLPPAYRGMSVRYAGDQSPSARPVDSECPPSPRPGRPTRPTMPVDCSDRSAPGRHRRPHRRAEPPPTTPTCTLQRRGTVRRASRPRMAGMAAQFEGAAQSCLRVGRVSIWNVGGSVRGVNNARATAVRIRAWCHRRSTGLVDAAGLDVGAKISQWVCASSPKGCPWKGRFVWPCSAWVRQRA
jgi:hypothetical protein